MSDFAEIFRTRSLGLVLPRDCEDEINRYVAMHSAEKQNFENRPFPRQVDFWMFSIVAALSFKLDAKGGSIGEWGKTFIYTSQGILDNNQCSLLSVIAVAKLGHENPEITEVNKIVDVANRLAGAGCPRVLYELSKNTLRTTVLDQAIQLAISMQTKIGLGH